MTIEEYKRKIAQVFENLEVINNSTPNKYLKISELCKYSDQRINCNSLTAQNYIGVDNLLQDTQGKTDSNFVLTSGTATAYKAGDILLSNIRPYLKKIWFADIDGGSSNDVLVLQKTNDTIISKYLYYNLKQDKFFDYEMQGIKGMKMPRGDKKQIMNYQIFVPSLSEQQEIVAEIETYEVKIAEAQKVMSEAGEKKKAILEKFMR
ncbi:MAG: restriction endonuclease subunit S, partial [Bacteroidales bacterium]|jgi:restriction endonuclease S subunit|nr:restriction endonuclease subunit S [Bacteroidales bacterium]